MKQRKQKKEINPFIKGIYQGLILGGILLVISMFIPLAPPTVDLILGNKITDNHINKLDIDKTNSYESAKKILNWQENISQPYNQKKIFGGLGWSVFKVDNQTRFFIRTDQASWFILTKIGNCGENGAYFYQVMNHAGFDSKKITAIGEDHVIASFEYQNTTYYVDPSEGEFIENITYFAERRKWSRIISEDSEGKITDLTDEILSNKSLLTINFSSKLPKALTYADLKSDYLMKRSKMYESPFLVQRLSMNNNSAIVGEKDYLLDIKTNYIFFEYKRRENISLQDDFTLNIERQDIINRSNFRINLSGYLLIFLMISIPVLIILKKKSGKLYKQG